MSFLVDLTKKDFCWINIFYEQAIESGYLSKQVCSEMDVIISRIKVIYNRISPWDSENYVKRNDGSCDFVFDIEAIKYILLILQSARIFNYADLEDKELTSLSEIKDVKGSIRIATMITKKFISALKSYGIRNGSRPRKKHFIEQEGVSSLSPINKPIQYIIF